MSTLLKLNLTPEQLELCRLLINQFGEGQHPYADEFTIMHFSSSYVKEVINLDIVRNTASGQPENVQKVYKEIVQVFDKVE